MFVALPTEQILIDNHDIGQRQFCAGSFYVGTYEYLVPYICCFETKTYLPQSFGDDAEGIQYLLDECELQQLNTWKQETLYPKHFMYDVVFKPYVNNLI